MSTSRTDEELYREFLNYLRERRKERRQQSSVDPFVLLERLIATGFRGMERMIARLVRAIIR